MQWNRFHNLITKAVEGRADSHRPIWQQLYTFSRCSPRRALTALASSCLPDGKRNTVSGKKSFANRTIIVNSRVGNNEQKNPIGCLPAEAENAQTLARPKRHFAVLSLAKVNRLNWV